MTATYAGDRAAFDDAADARWTAKSKEITPELWREGLLASDRCEIMWDYDLTELPKELHPSIDDGGGEIPEAYQRPCTVWRVDVWIWDGPPAQR